MAQGKSSAKKSPPRKPVPRLKEVSAPTKTKTATPPSLTFIENLKQQWMATVDAIVDPLMIVDDQYRITKANKAMAQHAGTDVKSLIGQKCHKAFAGRTSPCPGCQIKQACTSRTHQQFELDRIVPDRFHEVTSQPLLNQDGGPAGVVQIYRDRTEAKRMERQLMQTEKLASIGLLAGGVAHELNNPLGGILIFSQMLLREMNPSSDHYQDVQEIEAAAQRCKGIVENLLAFARQQPDMHKEELAPVNLYDAMKSAQRFSQVGGLGRNVDIDELWLDRTLTIMGDQNKMIQVFLNLFQNAFHAMPDGGTLTIRGQRDRKNPDLVVVEVEDTGVGIAKNNLKKIFDPFFTSKGPNEGTGLGLSICHGIITEALGTIEVKSELNAGTTFTIRLPLVRVGQVAV